MITLGDSILSEAPLLADRFLHRAGAAAGEVVQLEWMHIGSPSSTPPKGCSQVIELGRTAWYAELTDLLLALRSGQASLLENSPLTPLYAKLQTARYAVWLWETDEFVDSIDELTVRRLAALARWQTEQARGSLLCLESNLGRVTAEETLLWLTGCKTTARWDGAQWHSPPSLREYSMDDWRQAFAARLILRSVPTVEPLPDLDASMLIVPAGQALTASAGDRRVVRVPAVGESSCGLLFRGDRGTVATVKQACAAGPTVGGAVESSRTSRQSAPAPSEESLASAETLLRRAAELRESSRICLPNQSGSANHAH